MVCDTIRTRFQIPPPSAAQVATKSGTDSPMKIGFIRTIMFSFAVAGALFMATGCDNKPVAPVQTTFTSTTSGSVTPGYNYRIPQQIMTPDTVETRIGTLKFVDGLPTKETTQKMYDNLDFQHGVSVFLDFIPAASLEAIRRGQIEMKAPNANQVVIMDQLMDSAPLFLTGNADTVYASVALDLERDGPTVVEIPPGCGPGTVNDTFFRFVMDMGAPGPDRGKGGKYLILPPGYKDKAPSGYFTAQSPSYVNWLILRGFLVDGKPDAATKNFKDGLKVYPLAQAKNRPTSGLTLRVPISQIHSCKSKSPTLLMPSWPRRV
jgi:hypothetical protein